MSAVSLQALEQFRRTVLRDAALREALGEAADLRSFLSLTVRLGAERGFDFTAGEVEEALREARRAWAERWAEA